MDFQKEFFNTKDSKPHKSWAFTVNNYTDKNEDKFQKLECNYVVYGREVGKKGTPHLQGCITFQSPMRFNACKKNIFTMGEHFAPVRNLEACRNYCMKDNDYYVRDNRRQGERNDINDAMVALKEGGMKQVLHNHPKEFLKYHSGLRNAQLLLLPRRTEKPEVHWRWGKTGTGKTRYVWDNHDVNDVYEKDETQWWDGYEQQKVVIIDDFRGQFTLNYLLRLLDRYPMKVQFKGGYTQFNSPIIYITSNKSPENTYQNCGENIDQLLRRIDTVTEVTNGNTNISNFENFSDYI